MPHDIKSVLKAAIHGFLSPPPSQANISPTAHRPRPCPHNHEQEIHNALAAHNAARRSARGGRRPDLKWSEDLAAHAQSWANHLVASGEFRHEGRRGEGENLYTRTSVPYSHKSFRYAVDAWVEERKGYHGQKIGGVNLGSYGHYTQVIWPGTTHVGMASAVSYDGRQVIVARYAPCGNVIGMNAYHG